MFLNIRFIKWMHVYVCVRILFFTFLLINFIFREILFHVSERQQKSSSIFLFHSFVCVFCVLWFALLCFAVLCCSVLCYILVIFQTYNIFKRILCVDCFSFLFFRFLFLFFIPFAPHFRIHLIVVVRILNSYGLGNVTQTELINWQPSNGR